MHNCFFIDKRSFFFFSLASKNMLCPNKCLFFCAWNKKQILFFWLYQVFWTNLLQSPPPPQQGRPLIYLLANLVWDKVFCFFGKLITTVKSLKRTLRGSSLTRKLRTNFIFQIWMKFIISDLFYEIICLNSLSII